MKEVMMLTGAMLFIMWSAAELPLAQTKDTAATTSDSKSFTILHTNDSHGRYSSIAVAPGNATAQTGDPGGGKYYELERAGMIGGMDYLAAAVDQSRREHGVERTILVHGGDAFSDDLLGNLTQGEAMIQLMNALDYRFMALGNHDFDYGLERTRQLDQIARFPMRGANVIDRSTGAPVLGDPTIVIEAGGVRVGFLALGYHNTDETTAPKNVEGLSFTNGIEAARRYVPSLRERSDVVVVLSHLGSKVDELLAEQVDGIDMIVGGHSHDLLRKSGKTWIVQAMSDNVALGETTVTLEGGRITHVDAAIHMLWNDEYDPDTRITEMIESLRAPHRKRLEEVIATAAERIGRQYKSESPFDKLVGDILRQHTNAEIAMLPGIGYGVSLQPGPITREALYTLLPHPSTVVTLTLTGRQVLEILEQSATNQKPEDPLDGVGGLIQTSGLRWTVDLTKPAGQRIHDVYAGPEPLDTGRNYRVATHSGMLSGIHRYTTFAQGSDIQKEDRKVVDLVEESMRAMGQVSPPATADITLIR